jgi:hypothetical protein
MRHLVVLSAVIALVALMPAGPAAADNGDKLSAVPFEFVGAAGDCGAGYAAGSRIVTAAWLGGMGLPDNGGQNSNLANPTDNPNKNDPHSGLLLSKNGPTPDCSSSGARINGVKGMQVTATFELGFDYRNGGHCGAGAPRFNVTTTSGFSFAGGCSNGVRSQAPQDPLQWTRVRIFATLTGQGFPPIPVGSVIESISILYDEGTDTVLADDPMGIGLAVIDNIDVGGKLITSGPSGKDKDKKDKDKKDKGDDHDGDDGDDD